MKAAMKGSTNYQSKHQNESTHSKASRWKMQSVSSTNVLYIYIYIYIYI